MAQARNPYIAGNPVGGGAAFVGREDVLRAVKRVLGDPQHHGIVLYGQRRIGKTSILKHLAAWLPKNGGPRAIYFDLQDKAAQPVGAILVDLAGKIAAAMDLPDPEPVGEAEVWFRDKWLPPVLGGLPDGQSLVVLLDEFDVLADAESQHAASASFFGYLRELLEKVAPRLRLVFVIGRNLEELSYLAGPLFKALPSTHVSLMLQEEAESVVRLSQKNGSLIWSGEAVGKVWALTHGHPYLLQHLCWQVWQRVHEGGQGQREVSAGDVDEAVPYTLGASSNALEWLWGGLLPAAKVITAALARSGEGVISEETLEQTLKDSGARVLIRDLQDASERLRKWDIIEPVDGGHRFRVELLRRWIAQNKTFALVQQELDYIEPQAELRYKLGERSYNSGDMASALEEIQKATRLNPSHRRANELAAEIHISRSAWTEAQYVLEKLAENYPSQAKPRLVQVLLVQAVQTNEEQRALDLYERILNLDEQNGTATEARRRIWKSRGDKALDAGNYGAARDAYAAAGLEELVEKVNLIIRRDLLAGVEERWRKFEATEQYAQALDEIRRTQETFAELKDWEPDIARIKSAQELAVDYQRALGALKVGDRDVAITLLAKIVGMRPKYKEATKVLYETVSGTNEPTKVQKVRLSRWLAGAGLFVMLAGTHLFAAKIGSRWELNAGVGAVPVTATMIDAGIPSPSATALAVSTAAVATSAQVSTGQEINEDAGVQVPATSSDPPAMRGPLKPCGRFLKRAGCK